MKIKLLLLALGLIVPLVCMGDRRHWMPSDSLKIIAINSELGDGCEGEVLIDEVKKVKGEWFLAKQAIKGRGVKSITVLNKQENETVELPVSSKIKNRPEPVIYFYYRSESCHGKGTDKNVNVEEMRANLSNTFYIIGDYCLVLPTSLIIDEKHCYRLRLLGGTQSNGLIVGKDDVNEPFFMCLSKEMFKKENIDIESGSCTFRVEYLGDGETIVITDKFNVIYEN